MANNMNKKDNFISLLSSMTPEDMKQYIAEKGKEPKKTKLVVFLENE